MEHLALGLVLLTGTLAAGSPLCRRDLNPIKEVALDMALDSFDDQYRGCSRMMEEELEELNRTEFANNSIYAKAWTKAAAVWQSRQGHIPQPPALRSEQAVALLAYTLQKPPLYEKFNAAVREAGRSRREYLDTFHFKTLHFLLSEALRALRDARPRRCHRVYRGVRGRFTARLSQSVRFGHFTSTSLQEDIAKNFSRDTLFSVETCYGALISDFSFYPKEEEVLIPPFETFKVTNVTRERDGVLIELRSQDVFNTYNCELVKEKRCKNRPCDFSAGTRVPGDPPRLWGLLLAATVLATAGVP